MMLFCSHLAHLTCPAILDRRHQWSQPCCKLASVTAKKVKFCKAARTSARPAAGSQNAASQASTSWGIAEALLDSFWKARGVTDQGTRRRLVAAAKGVEDEAAAYQLSSQEPLPGIYSAWFFEDAGASTLPQVREVSRRLLALHQILGARSDLDIAWMVMREPALLSADFRSIMRRLLDMRVSEGAEGVDVGKLCEAQPALLLQQGVQVSREETPQERLQAWEHGLVTDNSAEWERRLEQLQQYCQQYGDAHVGHREGDDPGLAKWAGKQRSMQRRGELQDDRRDRLQELGFEFDDEKSEWLRWFNELRSFQEQHGHATPAPLAGGSDFLLINWCSVQRIAKRSRRLAEDRIGLLDGIAFDWSGADALS